MSKLRQSIRRRNLALLAKVVSALIIILQIFQGELHDRQVQKEEPKDSTGCAN